MNPFVIAIIVIILGYAVLHNSGKKNEEKFYAERAKQANPPEHAWVDNDPSPSAWGWCIFIALVGAVIIVKAGGF